MSSFVPERRWTTPYMYGAAAPNLDEYIEDEEIVEEGDLFGADDEGTYEETFAPTVFDDDHVGNAITDEYHGFAYEYEPRPQQRLRTHSNDGLFARDWFSHNGMDATLLHPPALLPPARPRRDHRTLDALLAVPRFKPWTVIFTLIGVVVVGGILSTGGLFNAKADSGNAFANFFDVGSVIEVNKADLEAAQKLVVTTGMHVVSGKPTITPDKIDAVLRSYNSPAAGNGKAFYDLGVKYGIDPAYALAFFINESTAGTRGVAVTSKSLGNIRWTSDCNCANIEGYRGYPNWVAGAEDWYKLISGLYVNGWGLSTVEKIVPVYAPSGDHNNPTAYINTVTSLVDGWRAGR